MQSRLLFITGEGCKISSQIQGCRGQKGDLRRLTPIGHLERLNTS